ncbi:unnamed protein product [Cyclocybe aegerita]|uniref:HNH nuclease domain-containing protein n=1 Tax=Cyclocybe aegerita TaxID=1973307 RepID=A0A8S0W0R6_CYCAE|nr:unnamed protein product [Cyclocybe aegerita]
MKGMLEHAVGAEGKRYVLAATLECGSKADEEGEGDEEWLKILVTHLRAVAQTWVFYLLFIFKVGLAATKPRNSSSHQGPQHQPSRTLLQGLIKGLASQGQCPWKICVITGFLHLKHLYGRTGKAATQFQVAHILRRAAASFPRENTGNAALTFDVLRNFTGLPVDVIENLEDHADHVANGLTLLSMAHGEWDDYNFCLKATEVDHVYKIHYFNPLIEDMLEDMRGLAGIPRGELVRFSDHSDDFQPQKRQKPNEEDQAPSTSASSSRSSLRFELPSKTFIAIHAAVGGVLHMSGAGKFFDELLDKYDKDDEKNRPVRSWDDFEDKIRSFHLNEWLRQGLRIGGATPA